MYASIFEPESARTSDMRSPQLLKVGIVGSVIAAVCCFTPILVVTVSAIGLSSLVGLLDYFLLPSLALFLIVTGYALWKHQREK